MHQYIQQTKKPSRGYALLLSILIINIILAMSLGIFSISLKELQLAAFLRDSQKAFGAADRAMECSLYWDRAYPQNGITPPETIFATSSAYVRPTNLNSAVCDGQQLNNVPVSQWNVTTTIATGTTSFLLNFVDGTCSMVTVVKDAISTTLTSNGYDTCAANNPRKTQRTIQVTTNI